MFGIATRTYVKTLILASAAGGIVLALWPRPAPQVLPPATLAIGITEPEPVVTREPVVAQLELPPAPPSREIHLVFRAGGATWMKLAALETVPRHGKVRVSEDDYITSAVASIADADVPAAQLPWLGKRVSVDGACTATITGFAAVSRLTGYPSYAGDGDSETWTAGMTWEHGAKLLAARLDNCAGGTYARDAALAPVIVPEPIEDAPLADAAVKALTATADVKAAQVEWASAEQKGLWYRDDSTTKQTQVLRHPGTGQTWVSVHLYSGGVCGLPTLSAWGLYRADADGKLTRVKSSIGELTEIQTIVDLDGDGELEIIGRPWLGTERAIQAQDGSELEALALPFYGCPC